MARSRPAHPVDTFPLAGRPQPLLRIESSFAPAVAFTGEKFPIDLVVSSPKTASGTVELTAEGKRLGGSNVYVASRQQRGSRLRQPERIRRGRRFRSASTVTGMAMPLLSMPSRCESRACSSFAGSGRHRRAPADCFAIRALRCASTLRTLRLSQACRLPARRLQQLGPRNVADCAKDAVEQYVKQGGGLLVIGGERNVYAEGKKVEDAMDRALPAKLAPPESPEGTCVVLIMDKSSSMEGRKMELAVFRQSASSITFGPRTMSVCSSLITRSNGPCRFARRKTSPDQALIAGVTPDGGTQIAPALVRHTARFKRQRDLPARRAADGRHLRRRATVSRSPRTRSGRKSRSRPSAWARM